MKFYASFLFYEFSPPEDTQTKVYGRKIEYIDIAVNLDFKIVFITTATNFFY